MILGMLEGGRAGGTTATSGVRGFTTAGDMTFGTEGGRPTLPGPIEEFPSSKDEDAESVEPEAFRWFWRALKADT